MPLGITIIKNCTFLELGDGHNILSKGKVVDVSIVTTDLTMKNGFNGHVNLDDVDFNLDIN